jgi:zinc transport system permease protein
MLETAAIVLAAAVAVAAGLMGCFAVMRRMALAADAISHVALPGVGVALALGIHPLFGAAAMLAFGALVIWGLERRALIATETVIGVVFSTALAIGSMTASGEELIDALFGASRALTAAEVAVGLAGAAVVIAFVLRNRHRLVIALISPEIARTSGIDVARLELLFLLTFALTVAIGLRYLGVLLMGSLVIIPAATAKRLARGLRSMFLIAVGVSLLSTLAGTLAAAALHRETGPVIVSVAAVCFFASLLCPRAR